MSAECAIKCEVLWGAPDAGRLCGFLFFLGVRGEDVRVMEAADKYGYIGFLYIERTRNARPYNGQRVTQDAEVDLR